MKQFIEEVKAHLEKVAQTDETFAAKFNAKCEAEQGSIEKCCGYIVSEVQRKYKTGNSAVLTKDEVFGIAMHYYDENIEPPKDGTQCKVVMSKEQLTPEDEEAIRREVRAAEEQRVRDEEAARIKKEKEERKRIAAEEAAAKKKETAEKKRKEEAERKRKEWEEADLLFRFDEE